MKKAILGFGIGIVLVIVALVAIFSRIDASRHDDPCRSSLAGGPPQRPARAIPGGGARALGLGGNRSCAAMIDGSLWCWGDDQRDPDSVTRPLLTDVLNEGRFHGAGYGCQLEHGIVTCWNGARDMAAPSGRDFVALWVGVESACGKRSAGAVECWGTGHPFAWNDQEVQAPTSYEGLRKVDDLVIGYDELWVRFDQRVARVSIGHEIDGLKDKPLPDDLLGPQEVTQCNAVRCARTKSEQVLCWSGAEHSLTRGGFHAVVSLSASHDQLCGKEFSGAETCESCDTLLHTPPSDADTASPESSCRVEPSGTVVCDSQFVVEGNGLFVYPFHWRAAMPSRRLAGVADAVRVSGDASQICVLHKHGPWDCSPLLSEGRANRQRGPEEWQVAAAPGRVAEVAAAESVAVNRFAVCSRNAQHAATCYGRGPEGTLRYRLDLPRVRKVVVGSSHACAIGDDDTLSCWGANESGQTLGKPEPAKVSEPTRVLAGVLDVALGLRQTCAVTRARGVLCFGDNAQGQFGSGTPDSKGFVAVSTASPAKQIVLGFANACALAESGTVTCWGGFNQGGQARPASTVELGGAALQLAAGGDRVCALLADRHVKCWRGPSAPTDVPGSEDSVELALGDEHACVRNASGRVRCWGSNEFGQAGLDMRVTRVEISPPKSCLQVIYEAHNEVPSAEDVAW